MTTLNEGYHAGEFLISEASGTRSREAISVASGSPVAGQVLGRATLGGLSVAAGAGNTGDGTLTPDAATPVLVGAQAGDYLVECTAAAADGGVFEVFDPAGDSLGEVAVGDTFDSQVKFVIADGAADFVVGDTFTLTVAAGSGAYAPLDLTALDGTQEAAAILWNAVDASAAAAPGVGLVRDAEVAGDLLTWPDGITAGQKSAAIAQLAAAGIIVR